MRAQLYPTTFLDKLFEELLKLHPLIRLADWLVQDPEINVGQPFSTAQLSLKMAGRETHGERLFVGLDLTKRAYDCHTLDQKGIKFGKLVNMLHRFYADESCYDCYFNAEAEGRPLELKDMAKKQDGKLPPFCGGKLLSQHLPMQMKALGVYPQGVLSGEKAALNSKKFLDFINSKSRKSSGVPSDKPFTYDDVAKQMSDDGFDMEPMEASSGACMYIRVLQSFLTASALGKQRKHDNRMDELSDAGSVLASANGLASDISGRRDIRL